MAQEKSMRSQAEQRSIELLQQRKDWDGNVEAKEKEIAELKKKVEELKVLLAKAKVMIGKQVVGRRKA